VRQGALFGTRNRDGWDTGLNILTALGQLLPFLSEEEHGSISAEHGVGRHKRDEITHYKSPVEIELMRRVKHALDPDNIMNPGKLVSL
jgi:hypothetical protein